MGLLPGCTFTGVLRPKNFRSPFPVDGTFAVNCGTFKGVLREMGFFLQILFVGTPALKTRDTLIGGFLLLFKM